MFICVRDWDTDFFFSFFLVFDKCLSSVFFYFFSEGTSQKLVQLVWSKNVLLLLVFVRCLFMGFIL